MSLPVNSPEYIRNLAKVMVEEIASAQWTDAQKGAIMRIFVRLFMTHLEFLTWDIEEFHRKFELTYHGKPRHLEGELGDFREKFMQEELDEYRKARAEGDLEGQFDALIDLVYVALGTSYLQGFPFASGWNRVHEANMAKVRAESAEDSKRGSTFDVVKPEGWTPPSFSDLLFG